MTQIFGTRCDIQSSFFRLFGFTLLCKGFVRSSSSPYGAPVILAEKSGEGPIRMCIDKRKPNSIIVPDHQPIPRIDDVLNSLSSSRYFSALDIMSGYWHIPMKSEDIPKTAFLTRSGHWEWLVMPFNPLNAPATFQRAIKSVLKENRLKNVLNYFEDIVVHSETFDEYLPHLGAFLKVIKRKFRKCQFFRATSVDYLGHTIFCGILSFNKEKIKVILDFSRPKRHPVISWNCHCVQKIHFTFQQYQLSITEPSPKEQ